MEPVEVPSLCQGKQSPAQVQGETRVQAMAFRQSYTECAAAPGRSLLNAPHAKQNQQEFL